jgi:DNA polymerase-1|tara:strand:- start:1786 stop:3642 length:1857 start_codon:yes stop_codon:yes gene_type:complete
MILETLKENFKNIVVVDTEFKGQQDEGQLNDPICVVFEEITRGEQHIFEGKKWKLPYPSKDTLYIAHNVIAEAHTFLAAGNKLPQFWWDTFIEDKKLNFGKVAKHSLLACCARYGIQTISEDLKKYFINKIILPNETYTDEQLKTIVNYCISDVEAGKELFLRQLEDIEKTRNLDGPRMIISQALFSGAAVACTAQVEFNGIHINQPLLKRIDDAFPYVKRTMIDELNADLDIYENDVLKQHKFDEFIERIGLSDVWPLTITGKYKTDENTLEEYKDTHPDIRKFKLAQEFISSRKLKGFIVGPDGKARCSYRMYGLKTGRTNPSTAKHPFNAPKAMRNLVAAPKDKIMVNFDYRSQEVAIAAYISGDPKMMAAVEQTDPYIQIAKMNNAVPKDATKASHKEQRNLYKTTTLAALYGQGAINMSKRMNLIIDYGQDLFVKIKNTFPTYFAWAKEMFDKAIIDGYAETKFGWRYYFKPGELYNPRTFYNFPIQAHGSEMLRRALIDLTHAGIEVNALIHDGIVLTFDRKNFRKEFIKAKKILLDASRTILNIDGSTNYFCDVDFQFIRSGMIQGKDEQKKFQRILDLVDKYPGNISRGTEGKNTDLMININNNKIYNNR